MSQELVMIQMEIIQNISDQEYSKEIHSPFQY
jgi:hypothetical protein